MDKTLTIQRSGASTPQWLFSLLNEQVRALTGQGFQVYFDVGTDALRQDWSKWPTIFCNPPFSGDLISKFVAQALYAADKGSTVVLILPHWPGYPWFQALKRRGMFQDIIGPVAFERPDGSKFVLNKGAHGTSLVVATIGPGITPASNGEPITKQKVTEWDSTVNNIDPPGLKVGTFGGPDKTLTDSHVLTSHRCNNDFLMTQVASLYFQPGDRIADVTFGKGRFWRQVDLRQYDFHPSDLLTVPDHPYDVRRLPYASETFDVHVLDPPYMHHPSHHRGHNTDYKNAETTSGFSHDAIIQLYREGMTEGYRILKPEGLMLVKCKDEIETSRQRMSHIEIHDIATRELGMAVQDLFVLTQRSPVPYFGRSPQFAKKNHSYLWVFRKRE